MRMAKSLEFQKNASQTLDTCTYDKTIAIPSRPTKLARRMLRMKGRESSIVYRSEENLQGKQIRRI